MARSYRRDARGRFAGGGYSGQTGGRGARLKASGTRSGGGAKMKAGRVGGTIGKPRGLKPQQGVSAKAKASQQKIKGSDLKRYRLLEKKKGWLKKEADNEFASMIGATGYKNENRARSAYNLAKRKQERVDTQMRQLSGTPKGRKLPSLPSLTGVGMRLPIPQNTASRGRFSNRNKALTDPLYLDQARQTATGKRISGVVRPRAAQPTQAAAPGRTKAKAGRAQRARSEAVLKLTRKSQGVVGMGLRKVNNPRIRKQQTGMTQLSLTGRGTPLVRYRRKP